jgi:hypothetical protein
MATRENLPCWFSIVHCCNLGCQFDNDGCDCQFSLVLHVVCLKVVCDCQFGRGSICPFGEEPCDCLFGSDLTATISTDGYCNFHICGSIICSMHK